MGQRVRLGTALLLLTVTLLALADRLTQQSQAPLHPQPASTVPQAL